MAAPLDRTWYNTLIDDDGSGTVGTVWNRTQVDGLLDTVDASLANVVDRGAGSVPNFNALALWADSDTLRYDNNVAFQGDALNLGDGKLLFPATANPSTNPYTLDDYREIAWTPALGGDSGASGQTYGTQVGRAVKIGGVVHCQARLTLTTLGTIVGQVVIYQLPFPNNQAFHAAASIGYVGGLASNVAGVAGTLSPGLSQVALWSMAASGGTAMGALGQAHLTSGFDIILGLTTLRPDRTPWRS